MIIRQKRIIAKACEHDRLEREELNIPVAFSVCVYFILKEFIKA